MSSQSHSQTDSSARMRVLFQKDLAEVKGIQGTPQQISRLMRLGQMPRAFKIGCRNAWLESDIDAWLLERRKAAQADHEKHRKRALTGAAASPVTKPKSRLAA